MMGHDGKRARGSPERRRHDDTGLPIRAKSQRLPASRPCAVGGVECRSGAGGGRTLPAADRGYRCRPLPPRIRGGDLRGSRLARACLGGAGAAPVGAFRRLCGGARPAHRPGARLSELRKPRRNRACGGGARARRAVAARPRRRAALSGRRQGIVRGRTAAAAGGRRSVRAAPRHEGSVDARPVVRPTR